MILFLLIYFSSFNFSHPSLYYKHFYALGIMLIGRAGGDTQENGSGV